MNKPEAITHQNAFDAAIGMPSNKINEIIDVVNYLLEKDKESKLYTEEEVLEAIDVAYWDGAKAETNGGDLYFNPKDYLPKR